MSRPPELGPDEVREQIDWILRAGSIALSLHGKARMFERRVDMQDIIFCLRGGTPAANARWSDEHEQWSYRIEGQDIEGDALSCVVAFEFRSLLIVVTVL